MAKQVRERETEVSKARGWYWESQHASYGAGEGLSESASTVWIEETESQRGAGVERGYP